MTIRLATVLLGGTLFAFALGFSFSRPIGGTTSVTWAETVSDEALTRLLREIRPQPGEDRFDSIPWHISLHEARVKAAKDGKPILLWEMDGHPLGCG